MDVSNEGVVSEEFAPTDFSVFLMRFDFGIAAHIIEINFINTSSMKLCNSSSNIFTGIITWV